jgi:hypothetical protein
VVTGGSVSVKAGISDEQMFCAQYGPVPLHYTELAVRYLCDGHGFGAVLIDTVYTSHSTVGPGDGPSLWTTVT